MVPGVREVGRGTLDQTDGGPAVTVDAPDRTYVTAAETTISRTTPMPTAA
jgi:hypothetical protein